VIEIPDDQPVAGDPVSDLKTVRRSYGLAELTEDSVAASWLDQLRQWYAEAALHPAIGDPNAMQLATVDADFAPDVRTVLARGFDERGVVFFTNYESAKGLQLNRSPQAAGVFAWLPLERQARFRGPVSRVSAAETADYFAGRPRGAQLSAWASPQSQVIADRNELESRLAEVERRYAGQPVEPPPFWGGFRIEVAEIEFWQGREFRLHDRIRFRRDATGSWLVERLAP
jgi:pyridoxamine 5'-phosphate oxidase